MIDKLIKKVAVGLDQEEIPYMIIGGQAVLLYGTPRYTRDIDITLGIDVDKYPLVAKVCKKCGFKILSDQPEKFAHETNVVPAEDVKSHIRLDFIFSFTPYERQAVARTRTVRMAGYPVRFAACEDVIIHKLFAGRAVDQEDVRNIVLKNRNKIDVRYIKKWLHDFDALCSGRTLREQFDSILKQAR